MAKGHTYPPLIKRKSYSGSQEYKPSSESEQRVEDSHEWLHGGLPSSEKPQSDTPRTDAVEEIDALHWEHHHSYNGPTVVPASFARQLERELAAAQSATAKPACGEAVQRDAARYRWLRSNGSTLNWTVARWNNGTIAWDGSLSGERLDAAIDAAMSAQSGDEESK